MSSTHPTEPQTLAVCSPTSPIAIWHVELAPTFSGERLSGAWLVDPRADDAAETLANLFSGCRVAFTANPADASIADVAELISQATNAQVVDLPASVTAIRDHIDQLRATAKAERAKPGKAGLTEPRFPKVTDVEVLDFPHVGEQVAGSALGLARGVETLVEQWLAVESQRLRRKYLTQPWGAEPRQIPLVVS